MEINIDKFYFDNFEEFSTWKRGEEEKFKSYYVQHSSSRIYGATKYRYLYCNRSGKVRVRGKGEWRLKSEGSCKAGLSCICTYEGNGRHSTKNYYHRVLFTS